MRFRWTTDATILAAMTALAAIFLLVFLTTPVEPAPTRTLPWKTFSEAATASVGADFVQCPSTGSMGDVMRAALKHEQDAYVFFYSVDTGRVMFLVFVGNVAGAPADAIGLGVVLATEPDALPKLDWITIEEAVARFPQGPCQYLVPMQAGA